MDDSADDTPMLGMDLPEAPPAPASNGPYRVLARKYRPQTFAELIGQDAMVRTLGNAIARDRLAHAWARRLQPAASLPVCGRRRDAARRRWGAGSGSC